MSHIQGSLDIYVFLCVITNIDDIRRKRKYGQNILQWNKNDFKSRINTNGDYCSKHTNQTDASGVLEILLYFSKLLIFIAGGHSHEPRHDGGKD